MPNLDQDFFDKENNSDVDITYLFNFFKRKSKIIFLLTSIAAVLGGILSFRVKPEYEGNFKIYDETNYDKLVIFRDELINKYALEKKFRTSTTDTINALLSKYLATQEYILKSPKTISPVFLKYNQTINKKHNSEYTSFNEWSKKLSLEFINDTDIISVTFKDKDRELLIETLNNLKTLYENFISENHKKKMNYAAEIIKSKNIIEKLDKIAYKNEDLKSKEFKEYQIILDNLLLKKNQQNNLITLSNIEVVTKTSETNKAFFVLSITLISFLLISISLLIIEIYSRIIYDFETLKILIKSKFLGILYFADKINSKTLFKEIIDRNKLNKNDLGFLLINSIPNKKNSLSNYIYTLDKNLKKIEISNLETLNDFKDIIIIACEGSSSYKDIELLNNFIFVFGEKIKGWIFVK